MSETENHEASDIAAAFYESWADAFNPDWDRMHQEALEICREHPTEECRQAIVDQIIKIETDYVRRQADAGEGYRGMVKQADQVAWRQVL